MKKLISTLVVLALAFTACGQEKKEDVTLKPGDPAPPLVVDKWVKGEPVKKLEKGKVYIIECWATWCGPCVAVIPHVTELQKKYKDKGLIVIGMNVWENDTSQVEPFVKKMGEKMDYRVATDKMEKGSKNGVMAETWMKAAGRNGIPCSFVVDREGKIAWIGHPAQMDKPLAAIIEGKFDPDKAAKQQAERDERDERLNAAMQAQDYDKALATIDEIVAADPEAGAMYNPAKVMINVQKKDYKAANKVAKELSKGDAVKDQRALMSIAYFLLQGDPKEIDVDLALELANKAVDVGGDMTFIAKSVVAKGHAAKGDYDKAVELQTEAMKDAEGPQKQQMQRELDEYKKQAKGEAKTEEKAEEK